MSWDPSVLRKYNSTGHFRLLNQVRTELRANPLVRPKDGETVGDVNRSKSLVRALENRGSYGGYGRGRRGSASAATPPAAPIPMVASAAISQEESSAAAAAQTFRERLNAIEMR